MEEEKKVSFNDEKQRAQEVYSKLIPYAEELLRVVQDEGIKKDSFTNITIGSDDYIRIEISEMHFYVFRLGGDDFTLSCSYSEKLEKEAGDEDA